ncbi:MAG: helix-hairpin-helix domain-containing protein [Candidatus Thermoplasmatota archaeon]|nr:helix-hairpin-helix domain-containing protein [Candidatus Thermoplasmatota archaeon]
MSRESEGLSSGPVNIRKQVKKVEMVDFLTSTGVISQQLATSLYDQGLNRWAHLIEGTEGTFTRFKGIGPAKEKALIELGKHKKMELEDSIPGLKEVLRSIPRITQHTISSLLESGYDSFQSFRDRTEDDLKQVKGVGPKMAEAILKAVRPYVESGEAEIEDIPTVEEATAEVEPEVTEEATPDERSLFQRIMDAISGFFGGKKTEGSGETEEQAPKEIEEIGEQSPEKPQGTVAVEDEEIPLLTPTEEPLNEILPEAASEEEPPVVEEVSQEAIEHEKIGESEVGQETKQNEDIPPQQKGFIDRIREMIFGRGVKDEPRKIVTIEKEEITPPKDNEEGTLTETPADIEQSSDEPLINPEADIESQEYIDFENIPGVNSKTAEALRKAGYLNIEELREAVPEDLIMIEGIGQKTAEKIYNSLRE